MTRRRLTGERRLREKRQKILNAAFIRHAWPCRLYIICNYITDPTGEYEPLRSTGELHSDLQLGTELCVPRRNFRTHLLLIFTFPCIMI